MESNGAFSELWVAQMFDPPLLSISIAGVPILVLTIAKGKTKFRNFLHWWMQVGRLNPTDPQGFETLSGPWVMRDRVEAIAHEDWMSLTENERRLIEAWTRTLPIGLFYD